MSLSILVVDDSPTVRGVIRKVLEHDVDPPRVIEAVNGREAYELLLREPVDVVFTDINMPIMGGPELIDKMAEQDFLKTVPVVVITVSGSTKRGEDLKQAGASYVLRKPLQTEQIQGIMAEIRIVDPHRYHSVLTEVISELLNSFAYMYVQPLARRDLPADNPDEHLKGSIDFLGRLCGTLEIALPMRTCVELAANALGADAQEITRERAEDAFKELLNITSGHILTAIAGEAPVFDCSLPQTSSLDLAGWQALAAEPESLAVMADGMPMLLQLRIGPAA